MMPKIERADIGIITVLPDCELLALLHQFGTRPVNTPDHEHYGDRFWHSEIRSSKVLDRNLKVVITAVGLSGNPDASACTTSLIHTYKPRLVCLVGIAAGIEKEVNYGDVVISQHVFGYEFEKRRPQEDSLRPRHKEPPFEIVQDIRFFNASSWREEWKNLIEDYMKQLSSEQLPVRKLLPKKQDVVIATIASGEKIFGDGSLPKLKKRYGDDLIKAGEMEGIGFAIAASRAGTKWIVVRGISDYGDPLSKSDRYKDRFHNYASISAAAYAYLFLKDGYKPRQDSTITVQEKNIFSGVPTLNVKNVLITMHDKRNLEIPLNYFKKHKMNLIATPNTATTMKSMGYDVRTTFKYTRTKPLDLMRGTLHPHILASIMTSADDTSKVEELKKVGLDTIDLVFVNSRDLSVDERMGDREIVDEMAQLQIGGPALLRWTLKQWQTAAAVVDPTDYIALVEDLRKNKNTLSPLMRLRLLRRAMQYIVEKDQQTARVFALLWPSV